MVIAVGKVQWRRRRLAAIVGVMTLLGMGSASARAETPPPPEPMVLSALAIARPAGTYGYPEAIIDFTVAANPTPETDYQATFTYTEVTTSEERVVSVRTLATQGTVAFGQIDGMPGRTGRWRLDKVSFRSLDGVLSSTTYFRSGTVQFSRTSTDPPVETTHTVDFAAVDVDFRPAPPSSVVARTRAQGAWLGVRPPEDGIDRPGAIEVTVSPGGMIVTQPLSADPLTPTVVVVSGLDNGTVYTLSTRVVGRSGVKSSPVTRTVRPAQSLRVFSSGDVSGDGRPDIIAESPWFEWCTDVYTYLGSGHGAITKRTVLGPECSDAIRPSGRDLDTQQSGYLSRRGGRLFRKASGDYLDLGAGWGGMRFIDGGAPWPAGSPEWAEHASILAVTSTGDLRVYNSFYPTRTINSGWAGFQAFLCPGDVSGDKVPDILAVDSAGVMWLYRGNGRGGLIPGRSAVGSGWSGMGGVFPLRDWNGDGRNDIGGITMTGELYLYAGTGRGTFPVRTLVGKGWTKFL